MANYISISHRCKSSYDPVYRSDQAADIVFLLVPTFNRLIYPPFIHLNHVILPNQYPKTSEKEGNKHNLHEKSEHTDRDLNLLRVHTIPENFHDKLFNVHQVSVKFQKFEVP